MKRVVLVVLLLVVAATPALARIQGAKGRRLQVFHDLTPYLRGTLILEEPTVIASDEQRVVMVEGLRWHAHEFLETRLRELPWTVRPWYDEFGPVSREESDEPVVILDTTLFYQDGGNRLAVEIFLRDQPSGRVLARFQGYGRARVRGTWPGARDDLQEISRVLTWYLAEELKVGLPRWNGFESEPYRRRDRSELQYRMLKVNKDRDLPRALRHGDPPINDEAHRHEHPDEE